MKIRVFLLLIAAIAVTSCDSNDPVSNLTNEEQILEYLQDNNITASKTDSGLYYVIDEPGSADRPSATSVVRVTYRGYMLNGDQFDGGTIDISLQQVIAGWTEGIQLFGRGGSGALYIPSDLAYGSRGAGSIPPFTPIAFDIELLDFQ
ncbi:MAG: FKBP-type peptidyl-prolyl cis-trans isomerase [Bacteroidota bacterium]